jgi:chromosomal replication initiator protein
LASGDDLDSNIEDRAAAAWAAVRDGLRRDIGARSFDQWLGRTRYDGFCKVDRTVALALPSAFMANWVQKNFADRLNLAWRMTMPEVAGVRILADDGDVVQSYAVLASEGEKSTPVESVFQFDPRLTFETFLVGDSNRIAHNAARAIAEGGPMRFNPLFVHGPTGQGKTHLLHATGHGYMARKPRAM